MKPLKVLMVNRPDALIVPGGDTVQMLRTKESLETLGVQVDIDLSLHPNARGYDVAHLFNTQRPAEETEQIKILRSQDVPVVLSPIYNWNVWEMSKIRSIIPAIFNNSTSEKDIIQRLYELRKEHSKVQANSRNAEREIYSFTSLVRMVINMADYLLPNTYQEIIKISQQLGIDNKPFSLIPNGVALETFSKANPDWFLQTFGIKDFILLSGRLEPNKNQLLTLFAVRDLDLPVVVVGKDNGDLYSSLCRRYAPSRTLFIPHLPQEQLASTMAAARVHVLASFHETTGLVNLEAALADCNIVVGNRGGEWEYLREYAYYCDPYDVESIRESILAAYYNYERDQARRRKLQELIAREFTWEKAAAATLEVYKEVGVRFRKPVLYLGGMPRYERMHDDGQPLVSIIIPVYDKLELTRRCLASLYRNTSLDEVEIIVVDNGSTDETAQFLSEQSASYNSLRVIRNEENLGFARACNQGANEAKGVYLVFLNNDTEPLPGWLEPLLSRVQQPNVGAVGSKLLYHDGTIQHAGVAVADHPHLLYPFHIYEHLPGDHPIVNYARTFQVVTGASFIISRKIFLEIGGFDESFVNGYEDVDLCFRLGQAGYEVWYEPKSVLFHLGSQTPGRHSHFQENVNLLLNRWLGKVKPDVSEISSQDGLTIDENGERLIRKDSESETQKQKTINEQRKPVASIIIPCHNQLNFTLECVDSILRFTPLPHEIIFVDNASTDGTGEYLSKLRDNNPHIKMITNKDNLGFGAACNQGMAVAEGDYVVILNNDTVVTPGWLEGLILPTLRDSRIGIVGPMSNYVAGIQLVPEAPYGNNMDEMRKFAIRWTQAHLGQGAEVARVIGFCMLIKADVIKEIGGFDIRFGQGNFEDDDFCLRARLAGYKVWLAQDVFIHHYGSRTFLGSEMDYKSLMEANWKRFSKKWGLSHAAGSDRGYDPNFIEKINFNPIFHKVPLRPALVENEYKPISIPLRRKVSYLMIPDWYDKQEAWANDLKSFVIENLSNEDITLVLRRDPETDPPLEEVVDKTAKVLLSAGVDPSQGPDIIIFDDHVPAVRICSLFQSVDYFLPSGNFLDNIHCLEAKLCGCQVKKSGGV